MNGPGGRKGPPPRGRRGPPRRRPPPGRRPPPSGPQARRPGTGRPARRPSNQAPPPAPPPQKPKAFEIRKGERSGESEEDLKDVVVPLAGVALPQSITQEEENDRLKERFGVESLPDRVQTHTKVQLHQSAGAGGPDRARKSMVLIALLILLIGGGVLAYFAYQKGGLDQLLGK